MGRDDLDFVGRWAPLAIFAPFAGPACLSVPGAAPPADAAPGDGALASDAAPICPGYTARDSGRYRLHDLEVAWLDARETCEAEDAHLVTITTAAENEAILRLIAGNDRVWIGLSDLDEEAIWLWTTGESIDRYPYWNGGEPNNAGNIEHCGVMEYDGRWNDFSCAALEAFVCECDA